MTLFTMRMEYPLPQEASEQFTIVDPLWVQLHKQTSKVQDILRRVSEYDYFFIPILLSCHWVLWTKLWHKVSKMTNEEVFHDPMNNEATGTIKSLADIVIWTICSAVDDHCIVLEG